MDPERDGGQVPLGVAAVTVSELKAAFPSFKNSADASVQLALDFATARTPADVWGDLQEQGITFLALHFLAIAPESKHMRKDASGIATALETTSWGKERRNLQNIVSSGYRVAKSGL